MFRTIRDRYHPLWRLRKSAAFRWFQRHFDPDWSLRYQGIRMSTKFLRDASLLFNTTNEEGSTERFRLAIKDHEVDLFLDIGANLGTYSWEALSLGVRDVLLFEPDPTNQRLIRKTIQRNKLTQCQLVPFAVSESVDFRTFLLDPVSGATGSLGDHRSETCSLHHVYGLQESQRVFTLALDILTKFASGRKVLAKIDVEGAESQVLAGGMEFIRAVQPVLLIECYHQQALKPLEEAGYHIEALPENCNYLLTPAGAPKAARAV